MYSLGLLYTEGKMGPADFARRWYAKAVEHNAAFAMPELAVLFEKGFGGPMDAAEAFRLYLAAAIAGDQVSMTKLGNLYQAGTGAQGRQPGRTWYEKAPTGATSPR